MYLVKYFILKKWNYTILKNNLILCYILTVFNKGYVIIVVRLWVDSLI